MYLHRMFVQSYFEEKNIPRSLAEKCSCKELLEIGLNGNEPVSKWISLKKYHTWLFMEEHVLIKTRKIYITPTSSNNSSLLPEILRISI